MFHTAAKLWLVACKQRRRHTYFALIPLDIFTMIGHRTAAELYVVALAPKSSVRPQRRFSPHYILNGRDLVIQPCIDPDQYQLTVYFGTEIVTNLCIASPNITITSRSIVVRCVFGNLIHLDRVTYEQIASLPTPNRGLISISPHGEQLYYPNLLVTPRDDREIAPGITNVCDGIEYIKKPNFLHIHIGTYLIAKIPCDTVLHYDYPLIVRRRDTIHLYDNRSGQEIATASDIPQEIARATLDSGIITICTTETIIRIPLILGAMHVPKKHSQIIAECIGRCPKHRYHGGICVHCGLREAQYY